MAKKQGSDDLYLLIHSLTAEEKGYFIKFAKRHTTGGNKYLELFNLISKQENFEEQSLKKKFKDYAVWKVYLFDMIMKCLLIYKTDSTDKFELMRQLLYIEVLTQKGLVGKSIQYIEKGLAQAREKELFTLQDEFLRRRYNQLKYKWKPEEMLKENTALFDELRKIQANQTNQNRYHEEMLKGYLAHQATLYGWKEASELRNQVDIDFLELSKEPTSIRNQRKRLGALYTYHAAFYGQPDFEKAYQIALQMFQMEKKLMQAHHPIDDFHSYIYALRALTASMYYVDRVDEVGKLLDKDWRRPKSGEGDPLENQLFFVYEKSMFYWFSLKHKEGEAFMNKNVPALIESRHADFYTNFLMESLMFKILFAFSNRNYQQAVFSIDEYESLSIKKNYTRYYKECEMIRVLIQVELENYEQAGALIHNILKREKNNLSGIEKKFLTVLRKMHTLNKTAILNSLLELLKNSKEKLGVLRFDVEDWVLSRKEGKTIAQVMEEKGYGKAKA